MVKTREHTIVHRLLQGGANPNMIIYAAESPESLSSSTSTGTLEDSNPQQPNQQSYFKGSTCLVEACRNRDMGIIDLLLKYSARDDDCKALAIVIENQDEVIASKLLALKAHKDNEYGINKKGKPLHCLHLYFES